MSTVLTEFFDHVYIKESWSHLMIRQASWPKKLLQQTLWRLQDFRDGDGLGFAVELFFAALKQLLSTYPSLETYSALYIGTFKEITSDRKRYTKSIGTFNLLFDVVISHQGFLRTFNYPDYIMDEVWELLGDVLDVLTDYATKGESNPDNAVRQLIDFQREVGGKYGAKAEAIIPRLLAWSS